MAGEGSTQREVMLGIWDRCGRDVEAAVRECAAAERQGKAVRRRNAHGAEPEAYARALVNDGRLKGWLPAPTRGWPV